MIWHVTRATLLVLLGAAIAIAEPSRLSPAKTLAGVTPNTVTFIQIAALDGGAAALGRGMKIGIEAAFAEANAAGGVHGRLLHLESVDDGYQPNRSVKILEDVIAGERHLALIGSVGTPTAAAMQPLIKAEGFPLVGPFTGAAFLRDTAKGPIVNLRATYAAEAEAWMAHLVDQKGLQRIAILYQDDGFGRVGLSASREALAARGMELVAEGTYTRNSRAVKEALLDLRLAQPDAVVMVGAYKPIAEFIRWSRELDFDPLFLNISFVGSTALAGELGTDGEGVIISQVVPFPWDDTVPAVNRYQTALRAAHPSQVPDFVSLEGYLTGRRALEALRQAGRDLTRAGFAEAFTKLGRIDFGGVTMEFSEADNQGMEDVFLTRIAENGTFEMLE